MHGIIDGETPSELKTHDMQTYNFVLTTPDIIGDNLSQSEVKAHDLLMITRTVHMH